MDIHWVYCVRIYSQVSGREAPWGQVYRVNIHWVYCVRIYPQVSGREGTMGTGLCGGHTLGVLCKDLFPNE